jgi:hypothetical protein
MTSEDLRLVGAAAAVRGDDRGGRSRPSPGGAFLAESDQRGQRRLDLVRQLGAPVGRLRGLDRYVTEGADGRHEVLATVDTVLPVEVLSSWAGSGQVRTTIAYEPHGVWGHIRRRLQSEHQFGQRAGSAITEVELANVDVSVEVQP